jgi:hypothetical protein
VLAPGAHNVQVTATDPAGNTGPTTAHPFTIDPTAPSTPSILSPAPGSDTNDTTTTLTGLADPGATVTVSEGATTLCTATADAAGNWS